MNRTRYTVTATVCHVLPDGWARAHQIPTFTLADRGCELPTMAEVARSVIDPYGILTVNLAIWDDAESASYVITLTPKEN